MRRNRRDGLAEDLLKGAIAGAVATWVMDRATTYMYQREGRRARQREEEVRKGSSAYEAAAEKGAALVGRGLTRTERERGGSAIHWGLGIGAGAVYAVLRRRLDLVGSAAGTAFGTAFWALMDEGVVPALRLTPGPSAIPWQTHARGCLGHLTFGTVTDGTLRVLDRVF